MPLNSSQSVLKISHRGKTRNPNGQSVACPTGVVLTPGRGYCTPAGQESPPCPSSPRWSPWKTGLFPPGSSAAEGKKTGRSPSVNHQDQHLVLLPPPRGTLTGEGRSYLWWQDIPGLQQMVQQQTGEFKKRQHTGINDWYMIQFVSMTPSIVQN